MKCKVCDTGAPKFIIYDLEQKEVKSALCANCASNMEKAFHNWLTNKRIEQSYLDDDIPF